MKGSYGSGGMLDMYLYESLQLLEQMEKVMLLEKNEEFLDEESIHEIFRIVHTIKGTSGIMMYDNIASAAHKLEDIFYYLRETYSDAVPAKTLAEYVFMASDFIGEELDKIKRGRNPDGSPDKIIGYIDAFLIKWKAEMRAGGGDVPPANPYVEPNQYYIAPAADRQDELPLKIDLGEEPESNPGDYVIKNGKEGEENIIGVSEGSLDKLTRLVESLMEAEKNTPGEARWQEIGERLLKVTDELKDTVTQMRRISLSGTFRRMHRIVYDASRKLDKEIEFIISGEELEVDRKVIAGISDPLMHIVRNAADHGIEGRTQRLQSGKSERGKIAVEARIEEDILYIHVKDDGQGIDKEKVLKRAVQRGITDGGKNITDYTDKEIFRLITYPGFTTKEKVTEYSGRGVGMDVVAKGLEKMNGGLEIYSIWGKGTEMVIAIPLI